MSDARKPPDVLPGLLIFVARYFSADPASLLAECHGALLRQDALSRKVWIPPDTVAPLSPAARRFLAAIDDALRYRVNSHPTATPASASPAGLDEAAVAFGGVLQGPASSGQDVITLKQAAALLGFRSSEWVRQLVVSNEISGRQEETWRRRWLVSRHSVIAWRERSGHGAGGAPGKCA